MKYYEKTQLIGFAELPRNKNETVVSLGKEETKKKAVHTDT